MKRMLCLLILAGCCTTECQAQVVRLQVAIESPTATTRGRATAVCIGETESGGTVYLTARHNFENAKRGWVKLRGNWERITSVNDCETADVSSFEVQANCLKRFPVSADVTYGQTVVMPGFGPEYWGTGPASGFSGVIHRDGIDGANGLHAILGDSGSPVIQGNAVVGIVVGYTPTMRRDDDSDRRLPTVYVGLADIRRCLQQRYQKCPPGGCQIYLRPQIQQPMIGIGIPVGPPRLIGVAEPMPRRYEPVPDPRFTPPSEPGATGPPGPAGVAGRDGSSVTQEQIESIVITWLESNRQHLVGPPGATGLTGPPGAPGALSADFLERLGMIDARLKIVETRPIRLVTGRGGKIIDDETYAPGEPLVIKLDGLGNVSDAK